MRTRIAKGCCVGMLLTVPYLSEKEKNIVQQAAVDVFLKLSDHDQRSYRGFHSSLARELRARIWEDWHYGLAGALYTKQKENSVGAAIHREVLLDDSRKLDFLIKLVENGSFDGLLFYYFLEHNILEYKGGKEVVSEEVLDKLVSYGFAYKSSNKLSGDKITITALGEKVDEDFFRDFQEQKRIHTTAVPGLYKVTGYGINAYIIILEQLVGDEYAEFRLLSENPKEEDLRLIFDKWLSKKELREDLGTLIAFVANKHPNLYEKICKEEKYMRMLAIFPRDEYEDKVAAWEEEKAAWEEEKASLEEEKATLTNELKKALGEIQSLRRKLQPVAT